LGFREQLYNIERIEKTWARRRGDGINKVVERLDYFVRGLLNELLSFLLGIVAL